MAAGSANPKRKKISLSLTCKEALSKDWGVNGHRLCSSFSHHVFGVESGLCRGFLVGLAALSLSLRPCVFKMCM